MADKRYLVRATNDQGKVTYYATDDASGGYPYFTPYAPSAQEVTLDRARSIVEEMKRPNREDGFPNTMLHQASGVSYKLLATQVQIEIVEIVYQPIEAIAIEARITTAEVEAKREEIKKAALSKLTPEEIRALGV